MSGTRTDLRPVRPSRVRQEARFVGDELRAHPGRLTILTVAAAVIIGVGYVLGAPLNTAVAPRPSTASPSVEATSTWPGGPAAAPSHRRTASDGPAPRRTGAGLAMRPSPEPGTEPAETAPRRAPTARPSTRPTASSTPVVAPSTVIVTRPTCGRDGCR